eukprot:10574994-Lingulodinium_polyedra.AAC.1
MLVARSRSSGCRTAVRSCSREMGRQRRHHATPSLVLFGDLQTTKLWVPPQFLQWWGRARSCLGLQ